MEIEPLLTQIDQLASHFGRVTGDLQAIAARGRAEDFRGVMQNTRLVLEAILRDLVTRELKQTPGKAMLDELISKFRQQANAGIIPPNVLAHMGTVQAWGNLSSHDHLGSLADESIRVGKQEVVASLNSMVAILSWYAGRLGVALEGTVLRPPTRPPPPVPTNATPAASAPTAVSAPAPSPATAISAPNRMPIALGGAAAALACLVAGSFWFSRPPPVPAADAFGALDAAYRSRGEPVPPATCRRADEAASLRPDADEAALTALHGAEADYLLARRRYEAGGVPGAELQRAAACTGFAAALSLSGKVTVREAEAAAKAGDVETAAKYYGRAAREFDAAIAASPTFKNARFNRALVLLKQNKLDDGVADLNELVTSDPSFSEAHFYLGVALEAQAKAGGGDGAKQKAREAFCTAFKQGLAIAKARCEAEP